MNIDTGNGTVCLNDYRHVRSRAEKFNSIIYSNFGSES